MELIDLSRFLTVNGKSVLPFEKLRHMEPVLMTNDLQIVDEPQNNGYANSLALKGITLVPIRRQSFTYHPDRTDFPKRVLFEMTTVCNSKCKMCPQMNLKRKIIPMDAEKYKNVVDELNNFGVDGLWLYHFGESLTHPHFKEIVDYVGTKSNLGYIWLSSNGILMNKDIIDFLMNSSLSYLNFSLQSIDTEKYRKIAPKTPAEVIMSNLRTLILKKQNLLGNKPFFRLQIIEQKDTLDEIDIYLNKFYDKCDIISVNMLEHTNLEFNKSSKNLREHKKRARCSRLERSDCFINSDGSVAICDNAYNHELDIGNIWKNNVYDIWNGRERHRILKMNEDGSLWEVPLCSDCMDYDL